jgi:hypothetical protein
MNTGTENQGVLYVNQQVNLDLGSQRSDSGLITG